MQQSDYERFQQRIFDKLDELERQDLWRSVNNFVELGRQFQIIVWPRSGFGLRPIAPGQMTVEPPFLFDSAADSAKMFHVKHFTKRAQVFHREGSGARTRAFYIA